MPKLSTRVIYHWFSLMFTHADVSLLLLLCHFCLCLMFVGLGSLLWMDFPQRADAN